MERVLVGGISGAGKTTMARQLARRFDLPCHELDALRHGPNWQPRARFHEDAARIARSPRWVTEDQYSSVLGDLLLSRADTYVWLDFPRGTVMFRVIRRSIWRAFFHRELWNGNREGVRDWLDPEHPVRWAWTRHAAKRSRTRARLRTHPELVLVHLTSPRAARAWLNTLPADPGS